MGFGAVAGWRRWIMNEEGEEVGVEAASFEWLTKIFFVWTRLWNMAHGSARLDGN